MKPLLSFCSGRSQTPVFNTYTGASRCDTSRLRTCVDLCPNVNVASYTARPYSSQVVLELVWSKRKTVSAVGTLFNKVVKGAANSAFSLFFVQSYRLPSHHYCMGKKSAKLNISLSNRSVHTFQRCTFGYTHRKPQICRQNQARADSVQLKLDMRNRQMKQSFSYMDSFSPSKGKERNMSLQQNAASTKLI